MEPVDKRNEIETYVKERDSVLLSGDVAKVAALRKKHSPYLSPPISPEVEEIAMHKAITGCLSLPFDYRKKSKRWLTERGYTSFDDGDLDDETA